MSYYMNKAVERVLNIKCISHSDDVPDINFHLIREFFRRVSEMLYELEINNITLPIFSCESMLNDKLPTAISDDLSNVTVVIDERFPYAYVRVYLIEYIKWNAFIDIGNEIAMKYFNIYEPLIRIFESGSSVGSRHGEFMIGDFSIGRVNLENERQREIYYFEE